MKKGKLLFFATITLVISAFVFNACTKDDTTPPEIKLKGDKIMTIELNSTFVEPGYTAEDDEDGDITSSVVVTGTVNVNSAGTYSLTYTVSDAAGNIGTTTRTVIVKNAASYLEGNYSVIDIADGYQSTYTDHITASSTVNNKVWVDYFANYENGSVYFTISGNTVTIPSQNVTCGSPSTERNFVGSGTITGTKINLTYTESVIGSNSIAGSQEYTKQ